MDVLARGATHMKILSGMLRMRVFVSKAELEATGEVETTVEQCEPFMSWEGHWLFFGEGRGVWRKSRIKGTSWMAVSGELEKSDLHLDQGGGYGYKKQMESRESETERSW